ncbi:MAG: hypothetical protein ACTSWR_08255 [Candidatus Helarchaeota archaeon]
MSPDYTDDIVSTSLRHKTINRTDVALTNDLDIKIENGDIAIQSGLDNVDQRIALLLKTFPTTWKIYPTFGVGLHMYIGSVLTQKLLDSIKQYLTDQLNKFYTIYDGRFNVICKAVNLTTIQILIEIYDLSGNTIYTKTIRFEFSNASSDLGGAWAWALGKNFTYYISDNEIEYDDVTLISYMQYDQSTGKVITGFPPNYTLHTTEGIIKPQAIIRTEFGDVLIAPNIGVSYILENPAQYEQFGDILRL